MDEFGEMSLREREAKRIARRQWFWLHLAVYTIIQVFLIVIWALGSVSYPWFIFPVFGWGVFVAAHAVYAFVVRDPEEIMVERVTRQMGESK